MNEDFYNKIGEMSLRIFPNANSEGHLKKLKVEADECLENPYDITEYSDCLLCVFMAAYKNGFTMNELVESTIKKAEILEKRKWMIDSNGLYQHIKEE